MFCYVLLEGSNWNFCENLSKPVDLLSRGEPHQLQAPCSNKTRRAFAVGCEKKKSATNVNILDFKYEIYRKKYAQTKSPKIINILPVFGFKKNKFIQKKSASHGFMSYFVWSKKQVFLHYVTPQVLL